MPGTIETVTAKLQSLTQEQLAQLDAFLTELQPVAAKQRENGYDPATARLSESAFAAIWSNPEDDVYDEL